MQTQEYSDEYPVDLTINVENDKIEVAQTPCHKFYVAKNNVLKKHNLAKKNTSK